MLPEPGNRLGLVIVGVKSLPLLEIKGSLWHLLEWISLLGLWGNISLGLVFVLLLLLFLLLGLLLLLLVSLLVVALPGELGKLLGVKLGHLGAESHLTQHSLSVGLIDNSGEPSRHIDEWLPEGRVQHLLVEAQHGGGHGDVSEAESLANQEGSGQQVVVQTLQGGLHVLLGSLGGVLVELHDAHGGEDPGAGSGEDLVVCHGHPLDNLCSGSSVGASTELIISNVVSDGIRLGQENSIRSFKGGNLAQGELFEKLRGLVGLSKLEVLGQAQLGPAVLGSDERLLSTEVVWVGVERTGHHACSCLPM